MKEIINYLSNISLAALAIFAFTTCANAQCSTGEVEVFITIDTDPYGFEIYWELVPAGDSCGSPNAIASGGNTAVGCSPVGNNTSTASFADPGAYGNSTQIVEGPFCLTEGQDYTLWVYDDWGDGGCSFSDATQDFSYLAQGAVGSFTFTATVASDYDVAIGISADDPNGWNLDYGRVTGYPYMPVSQLTTSETFMAINAKNKGLNVATNVNVIFNIDIENTGSFTNVYTDTLAIGTLDVDSSAWLYKNITDDSWYQEGVFRYQYIVTQDSVDGNPDSDTITDYFNLTSNVWSKVDIAQDGGPFGEDLYLPGQGSEDFVSKMEWGTVFYMPNGDSLGIDNISLRLYQLSSSAATEAIYYVLIHKIVDDGSGTFEIENDKQLIAAVVDTVTLTPFNASSISAQVDNFIDFNTGSEFMFESGEMYYISIYQTNQVAPGLNDGTTRNGLCILGQTTNHDGFNYSDSIIGMPFYNPLIVQKTTGNVSTDYFYNNGWTGEPEPSMILNLKDFSSEPIAQVNELEEVPGIVVAPNPTQGKFDVSLDLNNAQDVKFIITDFSGRIAHISFAKNINQETKTFDIANYPAGVYFFTVVADGARTTKRIVKK